MHEYLVESAKKFAGSKFFYELMRVEFFQTISLSNILEDTT